MRPNHPHEEPEEERSRAREPCVQRPREKDLVSKGESVGDEGLAQEVEILASPHSGGGIK